VLKNAAEDSEATDEDRERFEKATLHLVDLIETIRKDEDFKKAEGVKEKELDDMLDGILED